MTLATPERPDPAGTSAEQQSLRLYLTETAPAPTEKRALGRWLFLALLALALHVALLAVAPRFFPPTPPPPVPVERIDPAKLAAIKRGWRERSLLVNRDPSEPKRDAPAPDDARYESDRNRRVEREAQGRAQAVVPNAGGDGKPAADRPARPRPAAKKIPLANLSNFQGLPVPRTPEEAEAEAARGGKPGPRADQALNDPNLPVGAETMLNTVESVYYSFYARLYEQLGPLWQSRAREAAAAATYAPGDYETLAEIVIDADGNYVQTKIHQSSGEPAIDGAIHRAWTQVPRYPNPPRGLIREDGRIHILLQFVFRISNQREWQYVAPQRIDN